MTPEEKAAKLEFAKHVFAEHAARKAAAEAEADE
jgi:hypothetical protein